MTARVDSGALRWLIGGELARQRNHVGMSLNEVAAATGLPRTKINHMESARTAQRPAEVQRALEACKAPADLVDRLVRVASMPHGKPWWNPWKDILEDWNSLYFGLEGMATNMFIYESGLITGLFQTRDYAAAITSLSPLVTPNQVERFVELRMARIERLTTDPVLECHTILDESAVMRRPLTDSIMKAQLSHLLELSELPNVTLQIAPSHRRLHGGIAMGNYVILDIADFDPIAYTELFSDALFIREPGKVHSYTAASKHVSDVALSPPDTRKFIQRMWKEFP